MLQAYFQAEMPQPWPELMPPAESSSRKAPARSRTLVHGRWALAASLLALLLGHWALSGVFSDSATSLADQSSGHNEASPRHGEVRPPMLKPVPPLHKGNLFPRPAGKRMAPSRP
jgi:hypothetical protein